MTTLETLKAARAKIANRKNWTKKVYARDAKSLQVEADSPDACRWCALGAIRACAGPGRSRWEAAELLSEIGGIGSVYVFNDSHTHAEVLALYDKAIAQLEAV